MNVIGNQRIVKVFPERYYGLEDETIVRLRNNYSFVYINGLKVDYDEFNHYVNDTYLHENMVYVDDANAITKEAIKIAQAERMYREMKWDEMDESRLNNINHDIVFFKNKLDPTHREYSTDLKIRNEYQEKLNTHIQRQQELEATKLAVSARDSKDKKGGFRKNYKKSVKNSIKRSIKSRKYKNRK